MPRIEPFEKYWEKYENWFERNRFAYLSELEAVKKQLPEKGKGVEIGVGTGRFAAPLNIELGLEPAMNMCRIAKQRGIRVVNGIAESLPFADGLFDYALMVTTICFLDDIDIAFREVRRVLKDAGSFIIGFVDSDSALGRLYEEQKKNNEFYRFATFYSVDKVVSCLNLAGFRSASISQTIFNPLNEIHEIEPAINGYGQGSFVVIRVISE